MRLNTIPLVMARQLTVTGSEKEQLAAKELLKKHCFDHFDAIYHALKNLVDRKLIKDPDGDHMEEVSIALDRAGKVETA